MAGRWSETVSTRLPSGGGSASVSTSPSSATARASTSPEAYTTALTSLQPSRRSSQSRMTGLATWIRAPSMATMGVSVVGLSSPLRMPA